MDITKRKRTELALAESEARLRLAQELGGVGNFDWNIGRDEGQVSDAYRRIFGMPPDWRVTWKSQERLIHPDDLATLRAVVDEEIGRAAGRERGWQDV